MKRRTTANAANLPRYVRAVDFAARGLMLDPTMMMIRTFASVFLLA
jgi:hypothetical protein